MKPSAANIPSIVKKYSDIVVKTIEKLRVSSFVKNIVETFATRLFLVAIGLVASVIVARTLGPEGRGLFATASAVGATGVQFGNMGLHSSNTYYVSRDRDLLSSLLANSLIVSFCFGLGGSFIAFFIFWRFPEIAPLKGSLLLLAFIYIPFGLAYLLLQNLLIGIDDVRAYNKIELITKSIYPVLIMAILCFGLITAETAFLMSVITLAIGLIWALRRLNKHVFTFPKPSHIIFKLCIKYGIKAYVAALLSFLVLRADMFMVKHMLGAEQAGYYSIAVTLADMIYMLPVVVGTLLFPKLSAIADSGQKWNFTLRTMFVFIPVMLTLSLLAFLAAAPVINLLFGKEFLLAVPAFNWLLPGIVILSVNVILMNLFAAQGMPMITIYSAGIALSVNIVCNIFLIPLYGIQGASVSSSIAYGIMLLMSSIYIHFERGKKVAGSV